jgi:hypothetical protein
MDCRDQVNQKSPLCNQHKDAGIRRTPSAAVDPDIMRAPPPTGDGAAKGTAVPEQPRIDRGGAPGAAVTPETKKGARADAKG